MWKILRTEFSEIICVNRLLRFGRFREKLLEKEEKEKYIKTLHEKIEELSWGEQMLQDKLALWQEQKFQTQMSWDLKKKGIEEDIKQLKLWVIWRRKGKHTFNCYNMLTKFLSKIGFYSFIACFVDTYGKSIGFTESMLTSS